MKPHNYKAKNSGAYSSPRVLATLTRSGVTSFAELRETISLMLLLLQMKQPRGYRSVAEVSISISKQSTKTDSLTLWYGTAPSGASATSGAGSYVQGILPLTYPTSARKRRIFASK